MTDHARTKAQLINELIELRQQITELEAAKTACEQAEQALRESEAKLQSIFRAVPTGIGLVSNRVILQVNDRICRMLGYSHDELIGKSARIFYPTDEDFEYVGREKYVQIRARGWGTVQTRWQRKNGEIIDVLLSSTPLDPDNLSAGVTFTALDITQRKPTEEALHESEERYRSLFSNNHSIMLLVDPATADIVDANPAACSFYGYKHEELIAKKITDINMLSEEETFQEMERAKLENRDHFLFRHRLANGEIRDVEVYSGPIKVYGRKLLYSIIHDATKRVQAEDLLRKSEEKFRNIIESIPMGMHMYQLESDNRLVFVGANPHADQILGVDHNRFVGKTIEEAFPALVETEVPKRYRLAASTGQAWQTDQIIYKENEISGAFEVYAFQTSPGRMVAAFLDTTERIRTREALRESEGKYRTLFETMAQGVVYQDVNGTIISANSAAERILGLTLDQMQGRASIDPRWRTIHEDGSDFPGETHPAMEALKTGKPVKDVVMGVFNPKDEQHHWIIVSAVPQFRAGEDRPYQVYATFNDISERRRMEQEIAERASQLEHANRELQKAKDTAEAAQRAAEKSRASAEAANHAKSVFLANMSHELRTPLNGILGYAQILNRDKSLTTKQHEALGIIYQSGRHLLTMINDVLDLSKIEAGKMELAPTEFYFPDFLNGIAEIAGMQAGQKNLHFIYQASKSLPTGICADKTRLRQILLNLLSNAVKFTEQGSVILRVRNKEENSVSLRAQSYALLHFEVEDTGMGISPEKQADIFLPFHQGDGSLLQPEGTGLGLAISQELVHMMGSEIHLESVAGQGSTFEFDLKLPRVTWSDKPVRVEGRTIKSFAMLNKENKADIKILIADDRDDNRFVLKDLLIPLGFEILEAVNGQDALVKAAEFRPDLIFMDLLMPEMDGFETTKRLRERKVSKDVIIIAVSASAYDHTRQRSLAAGCNDYIPKPFDIDELLEKLRSYLQLEWIYEDQDDAQLMSIDVEPEQIIPPPKEELTVLLELAMFGDIMGIRQHMKKISALGPKYTPFVAQFEQQLKMMKMDEIEKLVRQYLEDKQ